MGRLVKIFPNGTVVTTEAKKPEYNLLHRLVGGSIERIRVRYEGRIRDAYVDEEGIMKGLPPNHKITSMLDGAFKGYAGMIHGAAVIWVPK